MSSKNLELAKKLLEKNDDEGGGGTILIIILLICAALVAAGLAIYFSNFLCSYYSFLGHDCSKKAPSPSPGPAAETTSPGPASTSPPTQRTALLQTQSVDMAAVSGQQAGENIDCEGEWQVTSTGFNYAGGCSQPCYDLARNTIGVQHESFSVRVNPQGSGRTCMDLAASLRPESTVVENPSTGEITTEDTPCNRNQPCMINCTLSDTYAIISGYGVSSSDDLCTKGLIPVQASFTVNPTEPFYNATCSRLIENAHAVSRNSCPNKPATSFTCRPGWTPYNETPLAYPPSVVAKNALNPRYWTDPTVGSGMGCWGEASRPNPDGMPNSYKYHWVQDNSQISSITCDSGYNPVTPLSLFSCSPIDGWYRCSTNEQRVPNISAQNGNPSSTALPGCAPCPVGQVSDGDKEPCHLPSQTCTPLAAPTPDYYTKSCS